MASHMIRPTPGFSAVREGLPIVFKCEYKGDKRKLSYANLPSFDIFKDNVDKLYEINRPFALKYTDPDGDLITMSSNTELEEAVSLAPIEGEESLVKIKIVLGAGSPRASKKAVEEPVDPDFKPNMFHNFLKSVITVENIERFKQWLTPENVERARDHLQERLKAVQQRAEREEPYTFDELLRETGLTVLEPLRSSADGTPESRREQEEEDKAMQQLREMGFVSDELNRTIYRNNSRNLQQTLNVLVNM